MSGRTGIFFGYGHDYKQALADFIKVAGPIPLPPRFAFGAWWSRYWAYPTRSSTTWCAAFEDNVPLDVLVIDMEWHKTFGLSGFRRERSVGTHKGWTGYSWNRLLFPLSRALSKEPEQRRAKGHANLHPASGVQPWEDAIRNGARHGH